MSAASSIQYPDILGAITGGTRANIGVVQVALAVRPQAPRVGRPFEVILLLQNASDAAVDVTAAIHLPSVDARGQKLRFICKAQRLVVGVEAAEVGYVVLPVTTLPDTAPGNDYKVGVELNVKALGKPSRIRQPDGGGMSLDALSDGAKERIAALRDVRYAADPRGRNGIEAPLALQAGALGQIVDFKPGWVSVCKLRDYRDSRLFLHRYGSLLQVNTLPHLKRAEVFAPLLEVTQRRFADAGFALEQAEALVIAKLLTLILEYATPRHTGHGHQAAGAYNIAGLLERDPFGMDDAPRLPHWLNGLIGYMDQDVRAASHPVPMLTRYLYEPLLRDGMDYAFTLIGAATGENLGSDDERARYCDALIGRLGEKGNLDLSHVYLPLVLGGILVCDRLLLANEHPADVFRGIQAAVESRAGACADDGGEICDMANRLLLRMSQKNGVELN
jgi:hypothetical protein